MSRPRAGKLRLLREVVRVDHGVSWQGRLLQPERAAGEPGLARQPVGVHVVPEGDVYLCHGTRRLPYRVVAAPRPRAASPGQGGWLLADRKVARWRTARAPAHGHSP